MHLPAVLLLSAVAATPAQIANPGFEMIADGDAPAAWTPAPGHQPAALTTEAPRSGERAACIVGDGQPRAWRQTLAQPATRVYTASGWFRARGLRLGPRDYARFYFHILYKDRPYSDATQIYRDIPAGTYDWTRFSVRLVPQTQWPIDQIWVTVAAQASAGTLDFDDLELGPATALGGTLSMEWANGLKPRILADMTQATPREALSPRLRRGHWKVIDYAAGNIEGKMVWASEETGAPPLTIPLNATGWHAVYLGLADPASLGCRVLARLTRDRAYVPRTRARGALEEVLFRVDDLTGQSLHIAQQPDGMRAGAGLAYVKLVPLTPEEVARVRADRAETAHRRLVATIDGFSYIYSRRPTTEEDLLLETETYRDSDFGTLILQMSGADMVNYPSSIGEMRGQDLDDFARQGDRYYAEAIRELAAKKINPTKTLIEGAHRVEMQVHVSVRTAAWVHTEPLSDFFGSRFYDQHPEWRCRDRDGTVVARMSFAVPEVRAHLVSVLREAVSFGADGANILFARGVPVILYEKPFLDLFQQRYQEDALKLPETDPRIRELRAELLTQFLREVRQMLDEEAARRGDGKRLALSIFCLANEADNLEYGLDIRHWSREKLVDLVLPYLGAGGSKARAYDLAFFREVCAPAGIPVKPTLVAWSTPDLDDMMHRAVELYDAGADGLTIWDANSGADRGDRWAVTSRLGHIEDVRRLAEEGAPMPPVLRFGRLGDLRVDGRYSQNWGF